MAAMLAMLGIEISRQGSMTQSPQSRALYLILVPFQRCFLLTDFHRIGIFTDIWVIMYGNSYIHVCDFLWLISR